MSREEAIEIFKRLKENASNEMHIETVGTAQELFDMAIQALSQDPTEKPMCDRNICISNEYNGIGCDECIINKVEQDPCDDLISREDAFEIIASNDATDGTEPIFTGRQVVALLSTLPSVTQKCEKCAMNGSGSKYCDNCGSKSGKWNKYYTSQKGNDVFNCKECGHTFVVTQGKDNMNFCPNCGCRMVEPQESEDKE